MRNRYEVRGDTTVIFVEYEGFPFETYISTQDLELAKTAHVWNARYEHHADSFYVVGRVPKTLEDGTIIKESVLLHRLIMNPEKHMVVDHINHVRWDNRRSNLQIMTRAENSAKQPEKRKSHGGSGVSMVTLRFEDFLKDALLMLAAKNQMNLNDFMIKVLQQEVDREIMNYVKRIV